MSKKLQWRRFGDSFTAVRRRKKAEFGASVDPSFIREDTLWLTVEIDDPKADAKQLKALAQKIADLWEAEQGQGK